MVDDSGRDRGMVSDDRVERAGEGSERNVDQLLIEPPHGSYLGEVLLEELEDYVGVVPRRYRQAEIPLSDVSSPESRPSSSFVVTTSVLTRSAYPVEPIRSMPLIASALS